MRQRKELLNFLDKVFAIALFHDIAVHAIINHFAASTTICSDYGAGTSATFQEHVAEAFRIKTRMNGAMRNLMNFADIADHAVVDYSTVFDVFIQFALVLGLAETADVEVDFEGMGREIPAFAGMTSERVAGMTSGREMFCGVEVLFDAFFTHDAADEHEMDSVGFIGIRERGKAFKVYAAAGKQGIRPPHDFMSEHKILVRQILKKHPFRLSQSGSIQSQGNFLEDATVLHSGSETGHIGDIRDLAQLAGYAPIDIGLDGIGEYDIGLYRLNNRAVFLGKGKVR